MLLALTDIMNWLLPISLGLFIGYLIATKGKKGGGDQMIVLDAEEFRNSMRKGQLIDIRLESAYQNEKINGSRNFPKTTIFQNLSKLRADQPIFIYDEIDHGRVKRVAKKLIRKGFQPVYVLKDGFLHWPFVKK